MALAYYRDEYDPREHGAKCEVCPLKRKRPVPPTYSSGKTKLILVGEAPGHHEEHHGAPFIGPSGLRMNAVLDDAKFRRSDCHITNAILCKPDDERTQLEDAIACCAPRLGQELEELPEEAPIVPLGASAAKSIIGTASILRTRGFIWHLPDVSDKLAEAKRKLTKLLDQEYEGDAKDPRLLREKILRQRQKIWALRTRQKIARRLALPTVHPAFVLRVEGWHPVLRKDMMRAARAVREGITCEDDVSYQVASTPEELRSMLRRLGETIAVDVETKGVEAMTTGLKCVGISDGERTVVAYPYKRAMAAVLDEAFRDRVVVTHNGPQFDQIVLGVRGIRLRRHEDTLIAHHAFASHLPAGLDHVVSEYVDASPWKYLSKNRRVGDKKLASWKADGEELCEYNAKDVVLTALAWKRMQRNLEPERHVYEQDMEVASLCRGMQMTGMRRDEGRVHELSRGLRDRSHELLAKMRRMTRKPTFHPARLDDVREALYGTFKAQRKQITATGLLSTSMSALEEMKVLDTNAGEMASLILEWRSAMKSKSTFLQDSAIGPDRRVHPTWKLGPVTGRLACVSPNLMNLPRYVKGKDGQVDLTDRIREIYVPESGYVFVYFDLSQAEMRFAAYLSQDEAFMKACEGDVHAGNAKHLFPDAAKQGWLDGKEAKEGKGKRFRDIAKNSGFAVTYMAEPLTVHVKLLEKGFDEVQFTDVCNMVDNIRLAYAGYFEYVEQNVAFCKRFGWLRTAILGRIRHLGRWPKPTEVANFPIQSGIADLMNARLTRMVRKLPRKARLVAQIHDAVIIECRARDAESVKDLIKETWAKPVRLPQTGVTFPMPIDLKVAERWSEL